MKPLAVKCVEIMWAVSYLRAFSVFPLAFATDHLINLAWSYGTQAVSSAKKVCLKIAISRPLNTSLCIVFEAKK